jgi:hypothetical protein
VPQKRLLALAVAALAATLGLPDAGRAVAAGPTPAVLVGAGDIASCSSSGDEATAKLLGQISGTVITVGDNAYPNGTAAEFANCYGPSWGKYKSRTRPAVGDNDYLTSGARPYYDYFGSAAGNRTEGWYSYDAGSWHIVVLNSNCSKIGGCGAGSPQDRWLRADLAAADAECIAAYWHEPRFSSVYGDNTKTKAFWDALYDYGADIVLSGHHHAYERFAPQDPDGNADPGGIREFLVGTGGKSHASFKTRVANSEVRNDTTFGVIKLTLGADRYDWEFVPVAGKSFHDTGSHSCRGNGPDPDPDPGTVRMFAAAADTRVDQSTPGGNFGSATTMKADGSPVSDTLIRFDVADLAGTVSDARLRLYVTNGSGNGPTLYPSDPAWSESEVTWNTRPDRTGGAAGDLGSISTGTWVEYDVTALVDGNGPVGFDLASTSSDGTEFRTREGISKPPELVVTTTPTP